MAAARGFWTWSFHDNIDDAKKDLRRAAQLAPEDKAVKKLTAKLDKQLERQKAKERKMAKSFTLKCLKWLKCP